METTMTTPRWRLAIVAGALLLLTAAGAGLVQAAPSSASTAPVASAPAELEPDQPGPLGERLRALRDRLGDGRLARLRQHLVHGTFTVLNRDGELITIQLDHGTIAAIGDDTITISEAGGTSVTVSTTAETKVWKDREPSSLAALEVGDEVVVHSIVEDGSATARFIVVPPPSPDPEPTAGS
jgi:preprotein translocase subunit YajC